MNQNQEDYYEQAFLELRERLIRVLGVATVNRLIERAVIEISGAHPAMSSLSCDDDTVSLDGVRAALSGATDDEVRNEFMALNSVLLLLVARLLGREIAERVTGGVAAAEQVRKGGVRE